MTPIDLERARQDTPACEHVLHFNNAGASLMPRPVVEAVTRHIQLEAEMGGYEAAARQSTALEHVYDAVAALLGCARDEVAIIENATRAWDMAFYSIPFRPGDRILTERAEYGSNYIAFMQIARRTGVQIDVIPNDEYGQASVEALRDMLDERVKLIAITHVPTNGGLVSPAAAIGQVAREAGILYLLDACQSVGQMPVDVEEIGCDFLSATARKFLRGPRGTGFLYVRRAVQDQLEPPFLDIHAATWTAPDQYEIRADARRFENWECNAAGKIGLGVAVDYAMGWGLDVIQTRNTALANDLRARLRAMPGVTVHDLGREQCALVTFTADGRSPEQITRALGEQRINVSITTPRVTLLDMQARGLGNVLRASVHYYNSEDEIGRFCAALERIVC